MITSDVMKLVDKKIAIEFVLNMRLHWSSKNLAPSQFTEKVIYCLKLSGIDAEINANTANSICTKIERKAKLEILP